MSDPNVPPQAPGQGYPPPPQGQPAAAPHGGPTATGPGPGVPPPAPGPYGAPQPQQGPPAFGAPAQGAPPGYGPPVGYAAPAAPPRPTVNPFKGIGTADFVRDGVAVVVLLLSLSLSWDWRGGWAEDGRSRSLVEVLLVTLLSVVSVGVPYLARAGVFSATWTVQQTRWLRIGLNAPYLVLVVVYLVLGLVSDDGTGANITLGTGAALGLAGALLAAQPRDHELTEGADEAGVAALWRTVLLALGGAVGLGYLASLVWLVADVVKDSTTISAVDTVGLVVQLLGAAALSLVPIAFVALKGSRPWRRALITVATSLTVVFFFGNGDGSTLPSVESLRVVVFGAVGGLAPWSTWVGLGTLLVPAAAVVAASPAVTRALAPTDEARGWIRAAAAELWLVAGIAVLAVVSSIVVLAGDVGDYFDATSGAVTTIVTALVVAGAAGWAANQIRQEAANAQLAGLVAAGAAFVLGIVILAVSPAAGDTHLVSAGHLLLAFGLPAGVVLALLGPRPVRAAFAAQRAALAPPAAPTAWNGTQQAVPTTGQWPAGGPAQGQPPVAPPPPFAAPPAPVQGAVGRDAPLAPPPPVTSDAAPAAPPVDQPAAAPLASPLTLSKPASAQVDEASTPQPQAPEAAAHDAAPEPAEPASVAVPAAGPVVDAPAAAEPVAAEPVAAPAVPPTAPQAPHGFTAQVASDPATPAATLAQIVEVAPELRAAVAANPSTYPALLDWLALLKDPAVDAALASRRP